MICYAVVDDYKKDASYAMKFKSVGEAKGTGLLINLLQYCVKLVM